MAKYLEYLRKSQMDRDYENLSVEETLSRHKAILADFVKSQKLNVEIVLEEVVSGESLSSRPQMLKLLDLVNTGEYDGVVCMDIDRLSRGSGMDSSYIMQVLQVNDCKIITPQKTYDLSNESDEQFADMKFMFSRYELQTINKRLKAGRATSSKEGKFIGSIAPYGYEIVKIKGEKGNTLKIVPEEAEVVRMIFNWYTQEGMGTGQIANRLNDLHIPPRNATEWGSGTIRQVIDNEHYIGKTMSKKRPIKKQFVDGKIVKKPYRSKEYELYEGRHEPIISEEQFNLAQKVRKEKYVAPTKRSLEISNPFAGVIRCELCGSLMNRVTPRKIAHSKPRFRCKKARNCGCKSHVASEVEEAIVEAMKDWLDGYILNLGTELPVEEDGLEMSLEMLKNRLEDLFEQQDTICELHEKKEYSDRLFKRRNDALEAEIDQVESDIADLELKISERSEEQSAQLNIIPTTQKLLDNYEHLTAKEKNDLWKEVLHQVTFRKTEKKGKFDIVIYPKLSQKHL
jgi:DNA invertase Pin-like site-specific DNA recombinase